MKTRIISLLARCLLVSSLIFTTGFTSREQSTEPVVRITQVDTSRFPIVTVYVSVTDAQGEPLPVDPSQLQLAENGVPIDPDSIQGMGEVEELTTMLVMDVSGSMDKEDKLVHAKEVAKEYVNQMRSGDRTGLMAFNTEVYLVQQVTADQTAMLEAIDGLTTSSDTAMYDALVQAEQTLADMPGRKAIIALTDGLDNSSSQTSQHVIDGISTSGLSISIVGLGNPNENLGSQSALDEKGLQSLAQQAGGLYGTARDAQSLASLYALYQRGLQNEYAITYTSPLTLRDGVNRALSVSLSSQAGSTGTSYNPGGLVPEVGKVGSWPLFFGLLAALAVLLFAPLLYRLAASGLTAAKKAVVPSQKSRIKLKPDTAGRIKLKK
jgi:VWFA-related protein